MTKLIYGKDNQVNFKSEDEKREAFQYLLDPKNDNIEFKHENNDLQGAWGAEDRIYFKKLDGVPDGLKRNMTSGVGAIEGRINCKELIDELKELGLKM